MNLHQSFYQFAKNKQVPSAETESTKSEQDTTTSLKEQSHAELINSQKIDNEASKEVIKLKRKAFYWIRGLVPIYLIVTFIFLGLSQKIGLSDAVVITLLTTTTTNIIGLPYLIIKSLFPDK